MKFLTLFAVSLMVLGCAGTQIKTKYDSFTGGTISSTDYLYLKKTAAGKKSKSGKKVRFSDADIELAFDRVEVKGKPTSYNIRLLHSYESDIAVHSDFGGKESLLVKIDGGEILKFSTEDRSARNAIRTVGWIAARNVETVTYRNVSEKTISKILKSKSAQVRVVSARKNYDGYIAGDLKVAMSNLVQGAQAATGNKAIAD